MNPKFSGPAVSSNHGLLSAIVQHATHHSNQKGSRFMLKTLFAISVFGAMAVAQTTITATFCGGARFSITKTKLSFTGSIVSTVGPITYPNGLYADVYDAGTDGSRYRIDVQCPTAPALSFRSDLLIPVSSVSLPIAAVRVAPEISASNGYYWDALAQQWKHLANGISGSGDVIAAANNTFTGTNTFDGAVIFSNAVNASTATATWPFRTGSSPPSTAECASDTHVGQAYLQTQSGGSRAGILFTCHQTGVDAYRWIGGTFSSGTTLPTACGLGDLFIKTDAAPAAGQLYVCTTAGHPGTWTQQLSSGTFTVASESEARAGTNNTNGMTPLRTFQAISEWLPAVVPPLGSEFGNQVLGVNAAGSAFVYRPALTIQQDGTPLTVRPILNFPSNMTCSDDGANNRTNCTPSGGGGGGAALNETFSGQCQNTVGGFRASWEGATNPEPVCIAHTNRPDIGALAFADSANNPAAVEFRLPENMPSTVTATFLISASAGTSQSFRMRVNTYCYDNGENSDGTFNGNQDFTVTSSATAGRPTEHTVNLTLTGCDASDWMVVRFQRVHDDAADTSTNAIQIRKLHILGN